ncbi:MAG TPA: acyltransferase [Candidatus Sulfotelmatobacter sp.]|nr:acyltransferase [Candidatus Sulfotelmatobacter sp.]
MNGSNSGDQKRILELDGLRGVAILLIILDHYVYSGAVWHTRPNFLLTIIRHFFPLSWSGVDLFFVLSGFLIGGILIDCRDSRGYFKTFYIRRACRILPLYLVWIAGFFFLASLLSNHASAPWYGVDFRRLQHVPDWSYFVFLQNFHIAKMNDFGPIWTGITWSLCVEEQFYLLMPLILWLTPSQKLQWVLVGLLLAGVGFRLFLHLYSDILTYVLLPCRADGLLLGVLCAYLVRHPGAHAWLQRRRDWLYLVFGILFVGIIYLTVLAARLDKVNFADWNSFDINSYGYSWIDAFYACLLLVVVTVQESPMARVMRSRLLRHFGVISYCMYLIHAVVTDALQWLILGEIPKETNWTMTLLAFLTTWALAMASWKYFEKPIIRWGHSFRYEKT